MPHQPKFDLSTVEGEAIAALYNGCKAAGWSGGDTVQFLSEWFEALGVDTDGPRFVKPKPVPVELDRDGRPIGDVLVLPAGYPGEDGDPNERLACRYCGQTYIKFVEDVGHNYPVRSFRVEPGGLVTLRASSGDFSYDDEGINERLWCVSGGHELAFPDWLVVEWV